MRTDDRAGVRSGASRITGQAVTRGARNGKVNLEWIYLSHEVSDKLTVQLGRKRIPFFYYSDSQDVGLAYPWIHLPPQMYGWEVVNYNGVSLYYKDTWGTWTSALNVFTGGGRACRYVIAVALRSDIDQRAKTAV